MKRSEGEDGLVPKAVVTVTSTVPEPAGEVAVIDVGPLTVVPVALAVPNVTTGLPAKLVPEMVTAVPPPAGPVAGLRPVTAGGGP